MILRYRDELAIVYKTKLLVEKETSTKLHFTQKFDTQINR